MERQTTPPTDDPFGPHGPEGPDSEPPPPPPRPPRGPALDPAALFVLLDGLRRLLPRELENQFTNLIREFLLTLRSLIDWYLERLDRSPREPRVEDIPIE